MWMLIKQGDGQRDRYIYVFLGEVIPHLGSIPHGTLYQCTYVYSGSF